MPKIQVDDDIFEGLQALATAAANTPNAVLRQILEAQGVVKSKVAFSDSSKSDASPWKLRRSSRTPQTVYKNHLLFVIGTRFNGRASRLAAIEAALDLMQTKGLLPASASEVLASNGQTKAESTMAWGRNALKDAGLIKPDSPRGIWELTPAGLKKSKDPLLLVHP